MASSCDVLPDNLRTRLDELIEAARTDQTLWKMERLRDDLIDDVKAVFEEQYTMGREDGIAQALDGPN